MSIYVLSSTTSSPLLVWLKIHLQKEIRRNLCIRIYFIILQTPRIEQFYFQFCEAFVDLLETLSLLFTLFMRHKFFQVYSSCFFFTKTDRILLIIWQKGCLGLTMLVPVIFPGLPLHLATWYKSCVEPHQFSLFQIYWSASNSHSQLNP